MVCGCPKDICKIELIYLLCKDLQLQDIAGHFQCVNFTQFYTGLGIQNKNIPEKKLSLNTHTTQQNKSHVTTKL